MLGQVLTFKRKAEIMTKTYKFYTKNNNNSTNPSSIFLNNKPKDYSEILDDIITADIIKKNSYLFDNHDPIIDALNKKTYTSPIILTSSNLKFDADYIKATKFLANYKKYNKKYHLPYIIGKMYTLSDGTPIIFYDDEIQIGFDTYKYTDFNDYSFLNNLKTNTKKTIINIYTFGTGNIEINLL